MRSTPIGFDCCRNLLIYITQGTPVDTLAILILIAGTGYFMFRHGKRLGSNLGFRVGRRRSQHWRRHRR